MSSEKELNRAALEYHDLYEFGPAPLPRALYADLLRLTEDSTIRVVSD